MSLTKRTYSINRCVLDIWLYQTGDGDVWMGASEVCKFLNYKDTDQAIRKNITKLEWKKTFEELTQLEDDSCPRLVDGTFPLPINWQNNKIFINEPAFYQLICSSKKLEARQFFEWVCQEVLPTLRRTGEFKLKNELAIKNTTIDQLTNALVESHKTIDALKQDVIHKPNNKQQLHSMVILKISNKSLLCLRRQKRSMKAALKKVYKSYPSAEEIFSRDLIPNAMNTWSMLKEHVLQMDQDARCKFNRLFLKTIRMDDVLQVIHELI